MNKKRSAKLRMVWRRCSNCGTTLKVPYKDIRKDADGDEMDIFCFDCITVLTFNGYYVNEVRNFFSLEEAQRYQEEVESSNPNLHTELYEDYVKIDN